MLSDNLRRSTRFHFVFVVMERQYDEVLRLKYLVGVTIIVPAGDNMLQVYDETIEEDSENWNWLMKETEVVVKFVAVSDDLC